MVWLGIGTFKQTRHRLIVLFFWVESQLQIFIFLQDQVQEKSCLGRAAVIDLGRRLFCTVSNAAFKCLTETASSSVWSSPCLLDLKASVVREERMLVCERTPRSWRQVATQHPTTSHGPRPVRGSQCSACYTPESLCAAVPECSNRTYSDTNILCMFYGKTVPHSIFKTFSISLRVVKRTGYRDAVSNIKQGS